MSKSFQAPISYYFARYDLFVYLIVARLKMTKRDLMLGYIWWLLDPLILMMVYWFLVTIIFARGGENYAFFILCGLIPFRAVSSSVNQSVSSVASKFNLISQINFPRIFLPLADVMANHVKLAVGFVVIVVVGLAFGYTPSFKTIYLLLPYLVQCLLVSALALFLSIIGAYVRDVRNLTPFFTRFWMYISPVLYSSEDMPEQLKFILDFNPMAPIIESYRNIFMLGDVGVVQLLSQLMLPFIISIILLVVGVIFFSRHEKSILKRL